MSRLIFWDKDNVKIEKEIIYNQNECKYKVNNICSNNKSKKLGKKCHYGCIDFKQEDNNIEPYYQ